MCRLPWAFCVGLNAQKSTTSQSLIFWSPILRMMRKIRWHSHPSCIPRKAARDLASYSRATITRMFSRYPLLLSISRWFKDFWNAKASFEFTAAPHRICKCLSLSPYQYSLLFVCYLYTLFGDLVCLFLLIVRCMLLFVACLLFVVVLLLFLCTHLYS